MALLAATAVAVAVAVPLPTQDAPPSLELRVENTIARAVDWLKTKQAKDGTWPGPEAAHPGGVTALACFALVKSGVERTDTALVGGLRAIAGNDFASTYSASVHLMLAAALREGRDPGTTEPATVPVEAARRSFDALLGWQREGLWDYPGAHIDMSNSQFALLGLRAGSQLGFEVPPAVLERSASAVFRMQAESGGFGYGFDDVPRGGMTAATLAGFHVIAELGAGNRDVESTLAKKRDRIRAAEAWMEARFDAARPAFGEHGWTASWEYAYLWAVERWCGLTGRRKLGEHDWYREGAEYLVAKQWVDGDWEGSVENTCFALLFLKKATMTGPRDRSATHEAIEKARRAAAKRLEPAADVLRITSWLVAGPYRDDRGNPRAWKADLARLRPRPRAKHAGEAFEEVELKPDGWTDLEVATGRSGDRIYWILGTSLSWEPPEGEEEELEATLWLAFEDAWKVWLDGELVSAELRTASPIREDVVVPVVLDPGVHTLVVLVADDGGASAFSARITDRAGKALPEGFSVAAVPPRRR